MLGYGSFGRCPEMTRRSLRVALGLGAAAAVAGACLIARRRHPVGNPDVPPPWRSVDLGAYVGRWYEVARYEQWFEKDCDFVTATYGLQPDGSLSIVNGSRDLAAAEGMPGQRASSCRTLMAQNLKVSFFGPFDFGHYWVMDHADDYSWSIVGDPSGRYFWLLHREALPDARPARGSRLRPPTLATTPRCSE
jgi:apolipoprotein D and lipocalin family protein